MKAKELIEILKTVEPNSEIYFTNFSDEDKGYKVEFAEKTETVYFKGYDGGCYLKIMLTEETNDKIYQFDY